VEAAILLIGDYPALLGTRAQLLGEFQTSATDSAGAAEALRKRRYDLLIVCQSVPESTAEFLIAHAKTLYPDIIVMTLSYAGEERPLGTAVFAPDIYHPSKLQEAVAALLKTGA
jgi:hypothetical protein